MIDDTTTVPLGWLIAVAAVLGGATVSLAWWWLKSEFTRLDGQHSELTKNVARVHRRLDYLIIKLLPNDPFRENG